MVFFRQLRARFVGLIRRRRFETEMAEEMRQHLEHRIQEKIAEGLAPDEARYAAQREFGVTVQFQEQCRDEHNWTWLEQARQDTRFAARGLVRSPVFTVVAVLTLALGIGVNIAIFTAVQAVLMRTLPYPDADQIVQVFQTSANSQRWPHAPAAFLELQAQNDVFTHMAAFNQKAFGVADSGHPAERVSGVQATAEIFPLLGVAPLLGRVFTAAEDRPGANGVAVLAHGFWMRQFAGDPNVLGRTLRVDGEIVTVIGVMPPEFRNGPLFGEAELWTPLAFTAEQRAPTAEAIT